MSSNTRGSTDVERETCHFCDGGSGVIEKHHIVPQRHGGTDENENLVELCPTCHEKLERLYDKRFYDELGVNATGGGKDLGTCNCADCNADADYRLKSWEDDVLEVCTHHKECDSRYCDTRSVNLIPFNSGVTLRCDNHSICSHNGCESRKTWFVKESGEFGHDSYRPYCPAHVPDDDDFNTYEVLWE